MKIKWLGHASVLIMTNSGIRIITDPFEVAYGTTPDGYMYYSPVEETADIVAITHEHKDHNFADLIMGKPVIVRGCDIRSGSATMVRGIGFRAIPTFHDDQGGKVLGENNVLCFEVDGLRICHTGDLGHELSDEQIAEIGEMDVVLNCVGQCKPVGEEQFRIDEKGKLVRAPYAGYIINCDVANKVYEKLEAPVTIPIHCSNERCSYKIAGMETFLLQKKNIKRLNTSEVEITKEELPKEKQIIVLRPAL